jgi:hypothetical protein
VRIADQIASIVERCAVFIPVILVITNRRSAKMRAFVEWIFLAICVSALFVCGKMLFGRMSQRKPLGERDPWAKLRFDSTIAATFAAASALFLSFLFYKETCHVYCIDDNSKTRFYPRGIAGGHRHHRNLDRLAFAGHQRRARGSPKREVRE